MPDFDLTIDRLKEILTYDPESGLWKWVKSTSNRVRVGDIAGRRGGNGYWQIGINGKRYPSAVLAVLYMTGRFPTCVVDHIDGDPDNGKWSNLREASKSQNAANRGRNSNNTSGYKGVTWARREQRWVAQIMVDGKHKSLGYFKDKELAYCAYCAAAAQYFGEFGGSDARF